MWKKYEKCRNHYLQSQLKFLTPTTINEIAKLPVEQIVPNQCQYYGCHNNKSTFFDDRAELAYGLRALPKLMKEIGSDDATTQFRAINSLSEYVRNPLHAQRAITQFQIVRRCQNIFLRIRMKYEESKYRHLDCLLTIFYYISKHLNGVYQIVRSNRLLDQLYEIAAKRDMHMIKASAILSLLSEQHAAAVVLINSYNVLDKLINIYSPDICVPYYPEALWLHLQHILQYIPDEAIKCGFFEILYKRIKGRLFQYHRFDLKCFGMLCGSDEGRKRFMAIDGVKEMYDILNDPVEKLDTYENVVLTLMNGILSKPVMWRCREFTDLPSIVTDIVRNTTNQKMQLCCLQLLRELGGMPCIKRYMKATFLEHLKNIECVSMNNKEAHAELLYWLQREVYHTSALKQKLQDF
ncbi:uncharacterized protein LOC133329474 [Musca vetustissima]|uniref:uncharacterized protein LOC133329474 n=1 Tax=Musca vetustissima TaxID=27455 RepID=UPI002AB755D5|nr:uncharacterized protein LOC133329474 [Musca vetustissima]